LLWLPVLLLLLLLFFCSRADVLSLLA
jgi:hypothetical protein